MWRQGIASPHSPPSSSNLVCRAMLAALFAVGVGGGVKAERCQSLFPVPSLSLVCVRPCWLPRSRFVSCPVGDVDGRWGSE